MLFLGMSQFNFPFMQNATVWKSTVSHMTAKIAATKNFMQQKGGHVKDLEHWDHRHLGFKDRQLVIHRDKYFLYCMLKHIHL